MALPNRHDRTVLAAGLVLLLALASFPASTAASRGPDARVLVTYDGSAVEPLAAKHGFRLVESYPEIGAAVVEGPAAAMAALARESGIAAVEPEGRARAAGAGWSGAGWNGAGWNGAGWNGAGWNGAGWNGAGWNGAGWNGAGWNSDNWSGPVPPWGLFAIRAPEAWSHGIVEHNRIVCIVDTGIDASHPDLAPNLWRDGEGRPGLNLLAPGASPEDDHGHGTHLAGIIAAAPGSELGIRGVGAPLIASAKALGSDGFGPTSAVIAGIDWCTRISANVILLALSEDSPTRALRQAVDHAVRDGILVVAAAGNGGPCSRCVSAPASYPGVLAVGSFGPSGEASAFSAKGPELDILAPGEWIASAFPGGLARAATGTSQSAAFVAGAAALLWANDPTAPASLIEARMRASAERVGSGMERLDLGAAAEHGPR